MQVAAAHRSVAADRRTMALIDAMPDLLLILNDRRQIVAVNRAALDTLALAGPESLLGRRPGEAFRCIHADDGDDGCGTGLPCTTCGAVLSIVTAQRSGKAHTEECRLSFGPGGTALDLEVVTAPLPVDNEIFYICILRDISGRKRREVLEKVFFHDVINLAGGIYGLASLLLDSELPQAEDVECRQWMRDLTAKLIEEIKQQWKLLAAERNEFVPEMKAFSLAQVLEDIRTLYANHEVAAGKVLRVEGGGDEMVVSDESIVRRILGNLVKNALEATAPGRTVTLSCCDLGETLFFSVHNPEVMPEDVRLQIFKRSFSTKEGPGRGIGTYSVKLFGEKYLQGKIGFTSRAPEGTTFTFMLPRLARPELLPGMDGRRAASRN